MKVYQFALDKIDFLKVKLQIKKNHLNLQKILLTILIELYQFLKKVDNQNSLFGLMIFQI